MRRSLSFLIALLAAGAAAQLRTGEARVLEDAMTLANLRAGDLGGVAAPVGARRAHAGALRDPLEGLNEAAARHASATGDETALLRTALGLLDGAPRPLGSGVADLPGSVPETLRRPVGTLVAAIAAANAEIRAATARLSAEERRTLIEALPRLASDDATLPLDFARGPSPDFSTVRRLLDLVDAGRIEAAGLSLAQTVREALPALQAVPNKAIKRATFRVQGVLVEISGSGDDVHLRRDVGLSIDLGGDDRYTGRYGAGVAYAGVSIDLSGNDRYSGPDANLGSGLLGIGLLYDLGGDDVYGVRTAGLGCGLAGVGLLADASGDDRYRVVGLGLGAGARGMGLFLDRLGDDAYDAGRGGEGFGTLGGLGWSVDQAGSEMYRGGEAVQAAAREDGLGLLTDLEGNDTYRAATGQATAVGGYASLGDLKGDDHYAAAEGGQAFAAEGGAALLVDSEGNDAYVLRKGPGQAAAFGAVAILLDREGDDLYAGADGAPARAYGGGVAILLEAEGDDRYLASGLSRREADGVALWADGNGRDRYGDGRADAQAAAGEAFAALDAFGASEAGPPPTAPPALGSLPVPPPEELRALRRQATDGPDRAAAVARLVGIGLPALESLAADPEGGEAFVAVAARMGAAAAPVVARVAASPDPRLAYRVAGFVPLPPEAIVSALEKGLFPVFAAEAAGQARTAAAVPALLRLAASEDVAVARAAVAALVRIGDPRAASTGAALVDHRDLALRRAAFALVLTAPSVAEATGLRLAESGDPTRQRIGLSLLGAVATPTSLKAVGPYLQKGREAKIGALLALDGHVPVDLIAAVEALRRDVDPLVRAVAERIDVG